jgi:hypothetical protein
MRATDDVNEVRSVPLFRRMKQSSFLFGLATVAAVVCLGGLLLRHGVDPLDESPLPQLLANALVVPGGLLAVAAVIVAVVRRER